MNGVILKTGGRDQTDRIMCLCMNSLLQTPTWTFPLSWIVLRARTDCSSSQNKFLFPPPTLLTSVVVKDILSLHLFECVIIVMLRKVGMCPGFVPAGLPSRGGGVAVYVFDINQPSLPTPFWSVFVPVSVFMALSTVFHSINSSDNLPLFHSVFLVWFLPYWSFQVDISLRKSPSVLI